jgi:imidazolonepropionase-like amidohydrolase
MKKAASIVLACLLLITAHRPVFAQDEAPTQFLFTNVNVWDGTSGGLQKADVLIQGNLIAQVAPGIEAPSGATVIDGGGRTLMPGLIDMHSHLCFAEGVEEANSDYDQMAMGAFTGQFMVDYLQQGFTTARDAGCNILSIARAVNRGRIPGPRLYPSGGFLSQTGGHADWGRFNELLGRSPSDMEFYGVGHIVNGRAEVLRAARHNLRAGATQIKIMAGGGVGSQWDPLHMTQFTEYEMRAAVEVAEDYGTYVLIHAYHDRSINRAIDAGIRVVEHGFLMSEETMIRMVEEDVALSLQAVMSIEAFANPEEITFFTPDQQEKARQVNTGAVQMLEWARKHGVLLVTGGDMFSSAYGPRQADNLIIMKDYGFAPVEILRTGTSNAAEVLSWSGGMNPYKDGPLGIIAEGAYADVILVDGDPLEDIDMIGRDHVRVVIKDGVIYKNTL